MKEEEQLDARYRSIAWGAIFILVGALNLIPGDQTDIALLGGGAILLGLNALRAARGMSVGGFSLALGAIAFGLGTLLVLRSQLGLHFQVELLPIVLIAIGVYWLLPRREGEGKHCC